MNDENIKENQNDLSNITNGWKSGLKVTGLLIAA
jgi:hypothetical protein